MPNYKTLVKEQMAAVQQERAGAISIFLNQSLPDAQRLEAVNNFGTFNNADQVQKAIAVLHNDTEQAEIRAAALERLSAEVSINEALMNEVIAILKNKTAPVVLRRAALTVLQASSFSSVVFPSKRAAYMDALRGLIDDEETLKQQAMEYLALDHDRFVQTRLLEGLKNPQKAITAPEIAIQLLSYDLHAEHYPVLRKIVENPPNKSSKLEALRNLAADPASKDLLLKNLKDGKEDPEIRHAAAVALEILNPGELQTYAKEVVLDDNENEDLKTAMLNTLTYAGDTTVLDDADFERKLDDKEKHNASPHFKKMYAAYKTLAKQRRN